jgi:2,4-dienoyl-CoA reductase-like NADH-dependent reductase (Old Yellow Enzyme family)/thioredoxin reductase
VLAEPNNILIFFIEFFSRKDGLMELVKLFEPGRMGKLEVKNRIVMAPLGHGFTFGTKDGFMTDRLIAFHEARAKGGVGLIQPTTSSLGPPFDTVNAFSPGVLTITDDEHVASARRWVEAIHAHGTKASFSISHQGAALARAVQMKPFVDHPEWNRVVTATGKKDPATGFETYSLTEDEIAEIVEAFGQAAVRGKAAGFDVVRLQGCHAYLIHQFLSPRDNKRTDKYGGSVENRARFACEIIKRVRKAVGPDFPILFRMNGDDHVEGGISLAEGIEQARMFVDAGADVLDVSSGPHESSHWQYPCLYMPSGNLLPLAVAIKKATGATVIAVGKIDAVLGERILQEGLADFIQMGRALMADPELPNKAKEGRLEEIRPCIYCGWCQAGGTLGAHAKCTVNMALGEELEHKLETAAQKKKVMVVGGGPAGMEAARTLAERGHETSLYEKTDKLGGQWNLVSNHMPEEASLVRYLSKGLEKAGVKVFLNQDVTKQMVQDARPDAVVVATGSIPTTLDIPGIDVKNVVQATDVLAGEVEVGKDIVVIGGRIVGLDVALYLTERSRNVSVVTRSSIGRGMNRNIKNTLIEFLVKFGVRFYANSVPDSITEKGINIWWSTGDSSGRDNTFLFLKADTIVLAVGAVNDNQLAEELSDIMPEVHKIGDCAGKRSIFAAMHGGSEIGHKI